MMRMITHFTETLTPKVYFLKKKIIKSIYNDVLISAVQKVIQLYMYYTYIF